MATYTTQVRSLIEAGYDLFDRERPFPIFKEEYRQTLEDRITEFYYFREIGLETAGQFKYMLNARLRLIMPYYNKMYETELIEYDPMETYNLTETFTKTSNGTMTNTSSNQGTSETTSSNQGTSEIIDSETRKEVYSDTPQGKLSGLDYATNLTENDDLKNQTNTITGSGENQNVITGSGESSNVMINGEDYERKTTGNTGATSDSRLIMDFRKSFIRIDEMIIKELQDLFFNLY